MELWWGRYLIGGVFVLAGLLVLAKVLRWYRGFVKKNASPENTVLIKGMVQQATPLGPDGVPYLDGGGTIMSQNAVGYELLVAYRGVRGNDLQQQMKVFNHYYFGQQMWNEKGEIDLILNRDDEDDIRLVGYETRGFHQGAKWVLLFTLGVAVVLPIGIGIWILFM